MTIKLDGKRLVNTFTGEILSRNISPKFQKLMYDDYVKLFPKIRYIEPQTCKEVSKEEIPEENYIAQQKFDGARAIMFMTDEGNRLFSRRISKKSNWFAENTDTMCHIRDYIIPELEQTVLDGEIVMNTFSEVASVTGALPETALQNQLEKGFAIYKVFDILYYKGLRVENFPLWKRMQYLNKVFTYVYNDFIQKAETFATKSTAKKYPHITDKQVDSFKSLLYSMWDNGMEGLIVKDLNAPYEQKRTKHFLKLKPLLFRDVVIMGFQAPTREYDGKTLEEKGYWDFWEDYDDPGSPFEMRMTKEEMRKRNCTPVTKPYAKGWIGAIEYGVYKDGELIKVGEAKGISDTDLEYIRKNSDELIGTVIEVKANDFMDKSIGSLRHPRFSRFRTVDKGAEQCTWEDYSNVAENPRL